MKRFGRRTAGVVVASLASVVTLLAVGDPALALPYPLPSGSAYIFSTPDPPQTNSFVTTPNYWSVVGIEPPTDANYDLAVCDQAGNTLGASTLGGSAVDFVAVNSNTGYRAAGTYQAVVNRAAGTGDYDMEFANPQRVLASNTPDTTQTIPMGPGEFITTADVWLNAGQVYTFFMGYFSSAIAAGVGTTYLMAPDSTVASAAHALWHIGATMGATYTNWTAPQSGWYALVTVMTHRSSADVPTVRIAGQQWQPTP